MQIVCACLHLLTGFKESRKVYLSIYNISGKQQARLVGVEEGQKGRVVTSFVTHSEQGDKNAAVRDFKKKSRRLKRSFTFMKV